MLEALPVQHRALTFPVVKPCEPYFGEPIGPRPVQTIAVLHSEPSRGIVAGIWECAPGKLAIDMKTDEFCHIVKGRWLLKSAEGHVTEVTAGDSFFFPKGWQGECEVKETVRKVFTVVKPQ